MLRLNVAIPPTRRTPSPLGVLGGDLAGFPNGRRLADDIVDDRAAGDRGRDLPAGRPTYTPDGAAGGSRRAFRSPPTAGPVPRTVPVRRDALRRVRHALGLTDMCRRRTSHQPSPPTTTTTRHHHDDARGPRSRWCSISATGRGADRAHRPRAARSRGRDQPGGRRRRPPAQGGAPAGDGTGHGHGARLRQPAGGRLHPLGRGRPGPAASTSTGGAGRRARLAAHGGSRTGA